MSALLDEIISPREVLDELKRVGLRKLSELKMNFREFERYMVVNYNYENFAKKGLNSQSRDFKE